MAPVKVFKNTNRKSTIRINVPPILSLRKIDNFDILRNIKNVSDPFLSPSPNTTVESSHEEPSQRIFFPQRIGTPIRSSAPKKNKYGGKVYRKRPMKSKSPTHIEYEKIISTYLRGTPSSYERFTQPASSSTPLKQLVPSTSQKDSPMVHSNDRSMHQPFAELTSVINQLSKISVEDENQHTRSTHEMFSISNVESREILSVIENQDSNIEMSCTSSSAREPFLGFTMRSSLKIADSIEIGADDRKDVSNEDKSMKDIFDSENMRKISNRSGRSLIESVNKVVESVVEISEYESARDISEERDAENSSLSIDEGGIHEGTEVKQEIDDDKEEDDITFETSACKERIILISEQESLAEDDEDKSEDVSSALSSDQEAREGISSSDLESNSIDEEKDFNAAEHRRHSFEKITPRKSSITGPFSRRRCLSLVPPILTEGKESDTPNRDYSHSFQSNKYYSSYDCDQTSSDLSDEERIPGRTSQSNSILSVYSLYENCSPLDPLPENLEENQEINSPVNASHTKNRKTSETSGRPRRSNRLSKDLSPSRQSPLSRPSVIPDLNMVLEESDNEDNEASMLGMISEVDHFVIPVSKKYRRSLAVIKQISKDESSLNVSSDPGSHKGRGYDQFVDQIIKLQSKDSAETMPMSTYRKSISIRRSSLLGQRTPPRGRRTSRISSIGPTSPIGHRQLPTNRPSLPPILLSSCNRSQLIPKCSPFKQSLQPNQTLLQNISRVSKQEVVNPEPDASYKDHVLLLCEQKQPISYMDILDENSLDDAVKVGEGLYGEVFMIARPQRKNVLKIIPIEGDLRVNSEKQKTYEEIYSELIITKWLDLLRDCGQEFMTVCFAELIGSSIIKGKYPSKLLELWMEFDNNKHSENDRPDIFGDDQLYLVLELGNAGTDLESYSFSTARQALSIFKQTVFAIAVAESCFEFEHRDLHWGNVLISRTTERFISFRLNGEEYKVITNGVKSTIIDYTLSRITFKNNTPIFNNIGQDPDMFNMSGDYQFEIYRQMKKDVSDRWDQFAPKTNVRWLHYLIDKMLKKVKYQRKAAKVHRDSMRCLQEIESWILNCDDALAVALNIAEKNK